MVQERFANVYAMIGPAGMVLLLFVVLAIYLSLKNFYFLSIVWRGFQREFTTLENRECSACPTFSKVGTKNPLVGVVTEILLHSDHSDDIRAEVSYLFHRNFAHVTRDLAYIRLISVISPLLGLLGTVLGMVQVFEAIAMNTSPDPALLAAGISSALLTTIMGLSVAVPTLMFYYFLNLKFRGFHIEAIEYSYRILDVCKGKSPSRDNEDDALLLEV